MQLDSTQIAIRERGVLEILDLSLHVARHYIGPLLLAHLLALVPLMLINQFLIGWLLAEVDWTEEFDVAQQIAVARYITLMVTLVFIEAPVISIFATPYLGQAVFQEQPDLWKIVRESVRMLPRLLWCHGVIRAVGLAWLMVWTMDRFAENYTAQEGLLWGVVIYVAGVRGFRPFINEVVLLERNPLRAKQQGGMTIGRRSSEFHTPSSGDLFVRWFGSALIGIVLVLGVFGTFAFCSGVFLGQWRPGPLMIQLSLPLSMWIVAGYFTVFRFLSYLDLRIRHEGWEVELRLRAEAARLAPTVQSGLEHAAQKSIHTQGS